jgi:uncharacterized protein (DUF1684 family)
MATMSRTRTLAIDDALDLLDWKRHVFGLYAAIRADADPARAWARWVAERDRLFREHPQTPLPGASLAGFNGLEYFDYDPAERVIGTVEPANGSFEQLPSGNRAPFGFYRVARVTFTLDGGDHSASLYWLDAYGGGLFLPFADRTGVAETYGGGRYLLDTVKGSDLGATEEGLVLDFNYAYNPSCSYDPSWACPLAPVENRLTIAVRAGERHRDPTLRVPTHAREIDLRSFLPVPSG